MKSFLLLLLSAVLIVAFQNCSQLNNATDFKSDNDKKASVASDATGAQPYDGKVYVLLGAVCPDGKSIKSRIVLKNESSGLLTRDNCQELAAPLTLVSSDFQLDPADVNKISFRNATWPSENPVNLAAINNVIGYGYWLRQNFGTPGDIPSALTQSIVRVFEDGVEMGPAHSVNTDIQNLGGGRFSHWDYNGATMQALYFSASDNSDPRSNGRKYTYVIGL